MSERMSMLVTIVERGSAPAMMRLYTQNQVFLHCQRPGRGTATSEIMDILGLGSSEKDILISYGTQETVERLMYRLGNDLHTSVRGGGIAFNLPLSGMNNLVAAAIRYQSNELRKEEGTMDMESKGKNTLILVTCSRGCMEDVMETAKKAGARGGTVFKARWTGMEDVEESYGLTLNEEREIVAIVVPTEIRNDVMEAVNAKHGLKSKSEGMLCSMAVDHMIHL